MRRLGASRHAGGDPDHRGGRWGSSAARWNSRVHSRLGAEPWRCATPAAPTRRRAIAAESLACAAEVDGPSRRSRPMWRRSWRSTGTNSPLMALTLGILCFAVVTAILLVRTRERGWPTSRRRRATRAPPPKAASTAPTRCCSAEPQILVAWAAGSHQPEIIGDPALITAAETTAAHPRVRHLAASRTAPAKWSVRSMRCARAAQSFAHAR